MKPEMSPEQSKECLDELLELQQEEAELARKLAKAKECLDELLELQQEEAELARKLAKAKECLDELLELQQEEAELARKLAKANETHKEAKAAHELKLGEITKILSELKQELPLFDKPEDVPWPFPLPEGTEEATLENVAADPVVLGLSIGIVKLARDAIQCSTLGQVQKFLGADKVLGNDAIVRAKKELGKRMGPNQAVKLLRGITSFTLNRKKVTGKPAKAPDPKPVAEPVKAAASTTAKPDNWQDTKLVDLEGIDLKTATMLAQLKLTTVQVMLDKLDEWMKEVKNPPKGYLAKRLAMYAGLQNDSASKVIDVVYNFESKYITGEAKQSQCSATQPKFTTCFT